MKHILVAVLLALAPTGVSAGPYFRLLNPSHPQISAGVWADPTGKATPDVGSSVCTISHSTGDGALIQSLQADWCLLAVGGGYGNGQAFMALGPSANLAPVVKTLGVKFLDLVAPSKYENLRELLSPVPGGGPDLNVAFGPQLTVKPVQNGSIVLPGSWQGLFRIFAGAAWKF